MCILCAEMSFDIEGCAFADPVETPGPTVAQSLPVYSPQQIADQLTDGFWASFGGPRSFELTPERTILYDVTMLNQAGRDMARQAFDEWSALTGIRFDIAPPDSASAVRTETVDAAYLEATAYSMEIGEDFRGTLVASDRDSVAITLAAGESIVVRLSAEGGSSEAFDPYLRLYDANGSLLRENDDATGLDSEMRFTAKTAGTYYLQAGTFLDEGAGDYRLEVRDAATQAAITFGDDDAGAYAFSLVDDGVIQHSFVNINSNWTGGQNRLDSYFFQTYLHEIGHALGLGHAGNYNGSAQYGVDNQYLNDSWQMSVMSYFHQTENTTLDASFAYAVTPMLADIVAIQSLYGAGAHNSGVTVYGDGTNASGVIGRAFDLDNPVTFTIYDTGGRDLIDVSSFSAHQRLDLTSGNYSDLGGLRGNVGISLGTIIERGATGAGNDTLIGNSADNGLTGGGGRDRLSGGRGSDALDGGAGNDVLIAANDADILVGGGGADDLSGGTGDDLLFGDGATLGELRSIFPTWSPPSNASALIANGDMLAVWTDIVEQMDLA